MPKVATGELIRTADGFACRVTLAGRRRPRFDLPNCATEPTARDRMKLLAAMARRFRRAGVHESEEASRLLEMAAAAAPALLPGVLQVAGELVGGELVDAKAGAVLTFAQVAKQWTSGELRKSFPDHVKDKDSDLDAARLTRLCAIDVGGVKLGDIPIDAVTLDHAERAMRGLDAVLGKRKAATAATRRAYAQVIHRVLALAVYPLRAIAANPLPKGFMPKVGKPPAFSYLYPAEDRALMACTEVPFIRRLLYGVLAHEGLRASEALGLAWRDVDLERGVVTLDVNKTDDPRAWALGEDVTRALAAWHALAKPEPGDLIFAEQGVPVALDGLAELFRERDLPTAKVTRHELFARTANRRPIRVHDLRGSFVTLALAEGRTETWVADRTGHRSSQMINRYRRASRGASELGLGWFAPLDASMPELASQALAGLAVKVRPVGQGGNRLPRDCPVGGGSTGTRTLDRRIKNPQL